MTIPPGLDGTNALVALEMEWADVHSMLRMPDGKITYYWLSQDHIAAACGQSDEGACIWEQDLEIDSARLPDAHELNHAYVYLRKQRKPVPFLAEGIAEAIGCGAEPPMYPANVSWEGIVGRLESFSDDVRIQGGIFVRHLIRTYGIDAFLRYYEQSPEQRGPALFAANFESFWHTTLDDEWTASHVLPPGVVPAAAYETKICPCSLPVLDPTGAVSNDPARAPYWVLSTPAGQTLSMTAPFAKPVLVKDCAGIRPPLRGKSVLARLDGAEPRYVLPPLETATIDSYLADDCAGAAAYPHSPLFTGPGGVAVGVATPATSVTLYLNLASAFSGVLRAGLDEVCSDCAFDQGTCQRIAPGTRPTVQGPLYGRMTLLRGAALPTDILSGDLQIDGS